MYVTKKILKNGEVRYLFNERYLDNATGKWRTAAVTKTKDNARTKKEAQAELLELIRQQDTKPDFEKLTLIELVSLYYADIQRTTKPSTSRRNYFSVLNTVRVIGEDVLCSSLTANMIKSKLLATGNSAGTLNERILRLKAMLRWAYRNDYITNISFLSKLERYKDISHRVKVQDKFLETEELVKLVDNLHVRKWKLLVRFMVLSGLRVGEAIALEDADVDLENCILHVTKTYDNVNRIVTSAKTGDSMREVYIQKELAEVCREIRDCMEAQRKEHNYRTRGLFLESIGGGFIQYAAFRKYVKEVSEEVLGRPVTTHIFRHTHTSLMFEAGVTLEAVSNRLGHADTRITKDIYMHTTSKLKEQYNRQFENVNLMRA